MKKYFKYALIILSLFTTANISAAEKPQHPGALVNDTILAWMQKNNIPGVAVEIINNGVPHSYYFGYIDPATQKPITKKTIFQLGSITKLFTCLLIANAVNEGKMQLDSPIQKYLPDLFFSDKKITILNLATHTSGMPGNVPNHVNSREKLESYFSHWNPPYSAGSQWAYSNVGMGLLGFALETAKHQSMDQMYRGEILGPLRMQKIGLQIPTELKINYAQGFSSAGKAVPQELSSNLFPGAYSMKASGNDMLQFLKAALGLPGTPSKINKAMRLTETSYFKVHNMLQGLAWEIHPISSENMPSLLNPPTEMPLGPLPAKALDQIDQQFNPNALIDKTGATKGFRSYIALIPGQKSGIVILTNRYVSNGEIVKTGRAILFGLVGNK